MVLGPGFPLTIEIQGDNLLVTGRKKHLIQADARELLERRPVTLHPRQQSAHHILVLNLINVSDPAGDFFLFKDSFIVAKRQIYREEGKTKIFQLLVHSINSHNGWS